MARKRKTVANGGATAATGEVETSKSHHGTTIPEGENVMSDPNGSLKEKPVVANESVRRSGRNKSILSPSGSQGATLVVKGVNQNGKDGESKLPEEKDLGVETQVEPDSSFPQPEVREVELSLEEKVDYLIRTVDEFKPKVFGMAYEGSSFDYKSLYIDTKKKYEELMEDHYELYRKLEYAQGQIAAFEKMKGGGSDHARLAKTATGAKVNLSSPQTVTDSMAPAQGLAVGDDNPMPMKRSRKKKVDIYVP